MKKLLAFATFAIFGLAAPPASAGLPTLTIHQARHEVEFLERTIDEVEPISVERHWKIVSCRRGGRLKVGCIVESLTYRTIGGERQACEYSDGFLLGVHGRRITVLKHENYQSHCELEPLPQ